MPRHPPYALISLISVRFVKYLYSTTLFPFGFFILTSSFQVNYKTFHFSQTFIAVCIFDTYTLLFTRLILSVSFFYLYAVVNVRIESNKKSTIESTSRFRAVTFRPLVNPLMPAVYPAIYLTKTAFIHFRCCVPFGRQPIHNITLLYGLSRVFK